MAARTNARIREKSVIFRATLDRLKIRAAELVAESICHKVYFSTPKFDLNDRFSQAFFSF